MAKIRLSRKAIADLDGIWDYMAQTWSEDQAVVYYRQIYTAIQGLDHIPLFLEKEYDIVKPGVLGYKVGHHVIFYKREKEELSALTAFSTRRWTIKDTCNILGIKYIYY